ncbi:MAG: cytochrome c3 family protein [Kiritimatiellia bacterium]
MKIRLFACVATLSVAVFPVLGTETGSHWNGGRTVPVHRLAPRDAEGEKVSPSGRLPRPISMEQTCGQCHDVASMHRGSHFRTGLDAGDAPESVVVEPWFWADEKTGTAIPLSLHGQEGAYRPADVGLSCWQWTKMFGRHFPGGGIGCDTNAMNEVAGDRQRWFVTGALGPNCLACHQQDEYDSSEWARQVLRENWQGAATAASGLARVGGMNERLESTWAAAENPDDHLFRVPETTEYDLSRFDEKGRCVFKVGKPKNENCLACHGVSQKGMPSHAIKGDVHLQRGLRCVDCHRNGMDHRVKTSRCAGCHMDEKGSGPKPTHAGIPLVHFQKLSCTVCHVGVTEKGELAQVRTPRANRIGVYGRAQWGTDCPYILEPVFVRNAKGVIEPRRIMWPCGFYRVAEGGALKPVSPEEAASLTGDALTVVDRVKAALEVLKDVDGPIGVTTLQDDGTLCYKTATNVVPFVTAEDRCAGEFRNLLATLFNAKVGVSKEKVAACRAGKVYTIDGSGTVTECEGVTIPEGETFPVGTLSADGKTFVPMVDKWTLEQYRQVKDSDRPFTQEMVRRALAAAGTEIRYLASGLVFSLDEAGRLVKTAGAPEARPVSWPIGHDVRAVRKARGASPAKCADCHTADSAFFLGKIEPAGPVLGVDAPALSQAELLGVSGFYHATLGTTFAMRPLFKVFLWTVFGLLCLFAAAAAAVALNRLGKLIADCSDSFACGLAKWVIDVGFVCSLAYLALSGVLGWLMGAMTGWWLVLHMVAGGGFAGSVVLIAAMRASERTERGIDMAVAWAFWVLFAAGTVFTAVMPMMTVFGGHGQEILLWSHRCVALCFAAVSCLICRFCLRGAKH